MTKKNIDILEKLAKYDSFLLILSVFLFSDNYFLLRKGFGILKIEDMWHNNALTYTDFVFFGFFFSMIYGAIIPSAIYLFDLFRESNNPTTNYPSDMYISLENLKTKAITENNTPAYMHYINTTKRDELSERLRFLSSSILLFSIISTILFFISNNENKKPFWGNITNYIIGDDIISISISVAIFSFALYIFIKTVETNSLSKKYVYNFWRYKNN